VLFGILTLLSVAPTASNELSKMSNLDNGGIVIDYSHPNTLIPPACNQDTSIVNMDQTARTGSRDTCF
jgi:hypothetical protein